VDALSSKENILRKIRKALQQTVPLPFPAVDGNIQAFNIPSDDLSVVFAEQFTRLTGKFAYCVNEVEAIAMILSLCKEKQWEEIYCAEDNIRKLFEVAGFSDFSTKPLVEAQVSITSCESLVARTGTIVLSSALKEGRTASVYAPVHICIATTGQLVFDIRDGIQVLQKKYGSDLPSLISFASGPSRTADIEKTLVVGVHGPAEVYCFLIEDESIS
jgi:L-lactate dehydrogenase complex protein LldG